MTRKLNGSPSRLSALSVASVVRFLLRGGGGVRIRIVLTSLLSFACHAAIDPAEWPQQLQFRIERPGLTRLEVSREVLAFTRADRGDVRLLDPAGQEVPWRLHRGLTALPDNGAVPILRPDLQIEDRRTILTFPTGTERKLGSLRLLTSASGFFKPVNVEGQRNGAWERLVSGVPLYRDYQGATELVLDFPSGSWSRMRLTVDDRRTAPIPIQGVELLPVPEQPLAVDPVPVVIRSRTEEPGFTRLHLDLGAAGLDVARLEFDTPDSLFTRPVRVLVERVAGDVLVEEELGRAWLHRIPGDEKTAEDNRRIRLNRTLPVREIVVVIDNGDSPPLTIPSVRAELYNQWFEFWASKPGGYRFLAGHRFAVTPNYDIARAELPRTVEPTLLTVAAALSPNPAYREPAVGPEAMGLGAAFNPKGWHRHQSVAAAAGLAELELSPEIMAHARPDLADVRLVRDGRQVPYVWDRQPLGRAVKPGISEVTHRTGSRVTLWRLEFTEPGLPLHRLRLGTHQTSFVRPIRWIEVVTARDGERWTNVLAAAEWRRGPGEPEHDLELVPDRRPTGAVSWIEIDNGDNPPLVPDRITAETVTRRLLFLSATAGTLELHFDNPEAEAPRYDLALLTERMPGAARSTATLGTTPARPVSWDGTLGEFGGWQYAFWGVLAGVVAGLFLIIRKLLPAPPAPPR